jgi:hypothetical protein
MKKVIVTTTINPVTEALKKFQAMEEWELVVIGDRKTPQPYILERGVYFSPEMQETYDKDLSDAIGWNCIQRRNFGLLWAWDRGADIVALIDDDNIPCDGWGENCSVGRQMTAAFYETDLPAFDPVGATNHKHLWHRGYPLQLVPKRDYGKKSARTLTPDIQADFWNGDPDVDAVCRMEHAPTCSFDPKSFPFAASAMAPFNSQNTFLSRAVLPHYFLYPHIGRMDDIWAAYYVQAKGFNVVFQRPSVYQDRNVHDPVKDMRMEYIGYENNLSLVQALAKDPGAIVKYLPERSIAAWNFFQRHFNA